MSASQSGNELTITGIARGNWVTFYVTTPDGLPRELDPAFTANYDVSMSMAVELPQSLDGNATPAREVHQHRRSERLPRFA